MLMMLRFTYGSIEAEKKALRDMREAGVSGVILITTALIAQGAIGTAQIADASITAAKVVSLNADVITSGTLATERLIITGANGIIYEINAEASGLSVQELQDDKYKEQMNKSVDRRQVLTVLGIILALSCVPTLLVLFTQLAGRMLPSILIGIALYFVFLRKK